MIESKLKKLTPKSYPSQNFESSFPEHKNGHKTLDQTSHLTAPLIGLYVSDKNYSDFTSPINS